jgi:hypothetical protein
MSEPGGIKFPFQDAFKYFQIDPVTNWERFYNPQFFITYNGGDVSVENHVLREVGSYGKQLGKIIDVLAVLVSRLPPDGLTPQERRAVDAFRELTSRVKAAVADVRGPQPEGVTSNDVERLVAGLQALAQTDPGAHRQLVERLRRAVAADEGG